MKVYHGSDVPIQEVNLLQCKPNKDFGRGFYVTELQEQAMEMAIRVSKWSGKIPVVTEFEFDEFAWDDEDLKTLHFNCYDEQWLDFIILNRSGGKKQKHDFDIVEGPVADDAVVSRIADYLDGIVSKKELLNELSFYKRTHQICFCSVNSLLFLKNSNRKPVYSIKHITKSLIEQLILDYQISEEKAADLFYSSTVFTKIADITTEFYLNPWQKIYEMLKKELKM
jgi:hypothetical protein